jgi:Flp pilus assembly protein TadG
MAKPSKLLHDRRGVAAWVFVTAGAALIGAMGFAIDVGVLLTARQALQANTNAAALDAAYQWDQPGGTEADAVSAAKAWGACSPSPCTATHPVPMVSGVAATASAVCITATSGLPTCGGTVNNAVTLTQTGTVPTYFIRVLGFDSWTVSAKATAARAGGPTKPLNIMFVLDTTASMQTSTDDTGCAVPGISSPTKLDCAKYGVQLVLKQLAPAYDQVGLMVFPGMSGAWTPCAGTLSTSSSPIKIVPYGTTGMSYQINAGASASNPLASDYATTQGTLNHASKLVMAVGDNSNAFTGCLKAPGGEGTFYADAVSAAEAALQKYGSSSAQNVIILLSDGEANISLGSSEMDATYQTTVCSPSAVCSYGHIEQQCNQAVANGGTATSDGTWVYVIAYDAGGAGTGCPTQSVTTGKGKTKTTTNYYDSPTATNISVWNPCSALQTIASEKSKFYSTNSSCSSVNKYADVASQFQQTVISMSQPRLVLY